MNNLIELKFTDKIGFGKYADDRIIDLPASILLYEYLPSVKKAMSENKIFTKPQMLLRLFFENPKNIKRLENEIKYKSRTRTERFISRGGRLIVKANY